MALTLQTLVTDRFRLTPAQRDGLRRLGIVTLRDLLYHFPARYGDTVEVQPIASLAKGDTAVVYGRITGLKASKGFRSRIAMADGMIEDESGRMHCVWFNQPYLAKMTPEGAVVRIEGKVSQRRSRAGGQTGAAGELYFSNPKIETVSELPSAASGSLFATATGTDPAAADGAPGHKPEHNLYPVYPETRGVSSAWIYHNVIKLIRAGILDDIEDVLPGHILVKYHLPNIRTALIWIHQPLRATDAESARKRFAFEEIFLIQLARQRARAAYRADPAFVIEPAPRAMAEFVRRFPFALTGAQERAISEILEDFARPQPMMRLLEGDVGSGKTAVAAVAAFATVTTRPSLVAADDTRTEQKYGNLQVAYMCPTEILAIQQFEAFVQYFEYLGIHIGLITSSGCRVFPSKVNPRGSTEISRAQLLAWVANGEIPILVGTHALIQKDVAWKHLALAVIDEQHRFGTTQRALLARKGDARAAAPHLLTMTATPIPRTLSLTIYGDLDLTLLDQQPPGRKPVITEIVYPSMRDGAYARIRTELDAGRQAYVICPRIDEPDPDKIAAIIAKSVKEEAARLARDVFPNHQIGVLHGKMSPTDKERVMDDWREGRIHILCSTSVVEVGMNVPNATVILIEGAERFGLAQMHQLRGRVMRSSHQAYCFCFAESTGARSAARLEALRTAKNGFELAELDLAQRGAGGLAGIRQWGVSDVAMDALRNLRLVEAARAEAARLVSEDPTLARHPGLCAAAEAPSAAAHLE